MNSCAFVTIDSPDTAIMLPGVVFAWLPPCRARRGVSTPAVLPHEDVGHRHLRQLHREDELVQRAVLAVVQPERRLELVPVLVSALASRRTPSGVQADEDHQGVQKFEASRGDSRRPRRR